MKCQILFSRKNKKNIISLPSAKNAQRVVKVKPHFCKVKLGFAGVYIIFLISAENIDCGYSLEPPCRGGSNEYP